MTPAPEAEAKKYTVEEVQRLSHLCFLYVNHGKRHLTEDDHSLIKLSDRNLIFIEQVGQSHSDRTQAQKDFNLILADPDSLPPEVNTDRLELIETFSGDLEYVIQVILRFAGSGKQVFFIDIGSDHESFALYQEAEKLDREIDRAVRLGNVTDALVLHERYAQMRARVNSLREQEVAQQIDGLIQTILPISPQPLKIAVVQGALHYPTALNFNPELILPTEIINLMPDPPQEGVLWLKIRLGLPVTTADYQRGFIAEYLLITDSDGLDRTLYNEPLVNEINLLMKSLTDEQVASAIRIFESSYQSHLRRIVPRSMRINQDIKKTYGLYAFRAAVTELHQTLKRWTGR